MSASERSRPPGDTQAGLAREQDPALETLGRGGAVELAAQNVTAHGERAALDQTVALVRPRWKRRRRLWDGMLIRARGLARLREVQIPPGHAIPVEDAIRRVRALLHLERDHARAQRVDQARRQVRRLVDLGREVLQQRLDVLPGLGLREELGERDLRPEAEVEVAVRL